MKIYVAGKWEEKAHVQEVQQQLRDAGHEITYDWTTRSTDSGVSLRDQAKNDLWGVRVADAFVGVFEKDLPYCGAYAELGIAAAMGIPIYVMGSYADRCIFIHLPQVQRGIGELINGKSNSAVHR